MLLTAMKHVSVNKRTPFFQQFLHANYYKFICFKQQILFYDISERQTERQAEKEPRKNHQLTKSSFPLYETS